MVDLEAPRREVKLWREKKIHGQFLWQLEEEGVEIKGRWNPALKLQSVV